MNRPSSPGGVEPGRSSVVSALGTLGESGPLSPEQKQFKKLISKIEAARQELSQWLTFVPTYQQRYRVEMVPILSRLREKRIAMARLFDQSISDKSLGKRQKAKVIDILVDLVSELLDEAHDAELVELFDRNSAVSFAEKQQDEMALMEAIASDAFGIELDPDTAADSPEELARRVHEKLLGSAAEHAAEPPKRKQNAKARAAQARRALAEQDSSKAVREVYRKLASELHPDRELDPQERIRKTDLMQQVNQAYEARDLLALLELQLKIEQIDPTALANLARERLAHYNWVLKEQLARLHEQLSETLAPFEMTLFGRLRGKFTPVTVSRALDEDLRELKTTLREIEADLVSFQDPNRLKASLKHYRAGPSDDELEFFESQLFADLGARRR